MPESTNTGTSREGLVLPGGLERAIYSGRLAADIVDRRAFAGAGDLLVALVEVSRERFFTPPERIREIGRHAGMRVAQRLTQRLRDTWGIEDLSSLPWVAFKTLVGQLSDGIGLGSLDLRADESSGLIRVRAWQWPLQEAFAEDGYVYVLLEGFVTSLLEVVSPRPLEAVEAPAVGDNDEAFEFVVGSQEAVRAYLATCARALASAEGQA